MRVETAKLAKGLKEASHKVFEFATSLKGLAFEGVGGYGMYKLIEIAGEAERHAKPREVHIRRLWRRP